MRDICTIKVTHKDREVKVFHVCPFLLCSLINNTDLSEGSVRASFNPHYLIHFGVESGLHNPVMGRTTSDKQKL